MYAAMLEVVYVLLFMKTVVNVDPNIYAHSGLGTNFKARAFVLAWINLLVVEKAGVIE